MGPVSLKCCCFCSELEWVCFVDVAKMSIQCCLTLQLGFGRSMPTFCVWLADVDDMVSEKYLAEQFGRYGLVTAMYVDRRSNRALVFFDGVECAQRAVNDIKNRQAKDRRLQARHSLTHATALTHNTLCRHAKHSAVSGIIPHFRRFSAIPRGICEILLFHSIHLSHKNSVFSYINLQKNPITRGHL